MVGCISELFLLASGRQAATQQAYAYKTLCSGRI